MIVIYIILKSVLIGDELLYYWIINNLVRKVYGFWVKYIGKICNLNKKLRCKII